MAISPDGQWLIALDGTTQQLDIFQINSTTGALTSSTGNADGGVCDQRWDMDADYGSHLAERAVDLCRAGDGRRCDLYLQHVDGCGGGCGNLEYADDDLVRLWAGDR